MRPLNRLTEESSSVQQALLDFKIDHQKASYPPEQNTGMPLSNDSFQNFNELMFYIDHVNKIVELASVTVESIS